MLRTLLLLLAVTKLLESSSWWACVVCRAVSNASKGLLADKRCAAAQVFQKHLSPQVAAARPPAQRSQAKAGGRGTQQAATAQQPQLTTRNICVPGYSQRAQHASCFALSRRSGEALRRLPPEAL
jgi:hypothetical protein